MDTDTILRIMPVPIRESIVVAAINWDALEEIRIRIQQPMVFYMENQEWYLDIKSRGLTKEYRRGYVITKEDIGIMVKYMSRYSLYAYEESIRKGFLTIEGGHRIGVAGQAIMQEAGLSKLLHITYLNIRIAREVRNCSKELYPYLVDKHQIYHTLLVSAPGIGKTTYLRDLIRIISDGTGEVEGKRVSIVDERSEIAACKEGVPQLDIGRRSDVLDGCEKSIGMLYMLRSMAPEVIAVDEIGGIRDVYLLEQMMYSGCTVLGTVHASTMEELVQKSYFSKMLKRQVFQRIVILRKNVEGKRQFQIYDEELRQIC